MAMESQPLRLVMDNIQKPSFWQKQIQN